MSAWDRREAGRAAGRAALAGCLVVGLAALLAAIVDPARLGHWIGVAATGAFGILPLVIVAALRAKRSAREGGDDSHGR